MILINETIKTLFGRMPILSISKNRQILPINTRRYIQAMRLRDKIHTEDQLLINLKYIADNYFGDINIPEGLSSYGCESIFNLLIYFCEENLESDGSKIDVKFDHLLKWHDVTSFLGEDLFITAYLASYDHKNKGNENLVRNMHWPDTLKCSHSQIPNFFEDKNLSDIHFHLKGSSSNFSLMWLYMMNYPINSSREFYKEDNKHFLSLHLLDSDQDNITIAKCIQKAASIRLVLTDSTYESLLQSAEEDNEIEFQNRLKNAVSTKLKDTEGTIILFNDKSCLLDYIFDEFDKLPYHDPAYYLYSVHTERRFLYTQFRRILNQDDESTKVSTLLYQYILLKSVIRRECVQLNDSVGFSYFDLFDKRKSPKRIYKELLPHISIASSNNLNKIYVEARIAPPSFNNLADVGEYSKEYANNLTKINNNINPYISILDKKHHKENDWQYDFVIHFIKNKDKTENKNGLGVVQPRHFLNRIELYSQAVGLYNALKNENELTHLRIVGIDAANSEINCRPEVFAVIFRFLSKIHNNGFCKQIGITYHVGEDFLDIVDGLRAVDEVLVFMNFDNRSRFGHALVLGTNVNEYYNSRDNRVVLPAQLLLDNLAWLYLQSDVIKTHRKKSVDSILKRFVELFNDIYGDSFKEYTIYDYIDSWRLRGDDPSTYIEEKSVPDLSESIMAPYFNNDNEQCIKSRLNEKARILYIHYHTNEIVRKKGEKIVIWAVEEDLISLIDDIRQHMLDLVERKGIHIECNPTSNVRIAGLKRYDSHPIIEFYNDTFHKYKVDLGAFHKRNISVSINTDDKGIFDTSLEREILLMTRALTKILEYHPHKDAIIKEWIDNVLQEGRNRAFISQFN